MLDIFKNLVMGVGLLVFIAAVLLLIVFVVGKTYRAFRVNISKKTPVASGFFNALYARRRLIKCSRRIAVIIAQLKEKNAPDDLIDIADYHRMKINDSIDNCNNALKGLLGNKSVDSIIAEWDRIKSRRRGKATPINDNEEVHQKQV